MITNQGFSSNRLVAWIVVGVVTLALSACRGNDPHPISSGIELPPPQVTTIAVPVAGEPKPVDPAWRQKNIESFDYVWETIRDKHYDPTLGGVDWAAVREELRPRVANATDPYQVRSVLEEMVQRLGQSHFGIAGATSEEVAGAGGDGVIGFDVRIVDDVPVVVSVVEGSSAARAGVETGWVVRAIDGVPITDWWEKAEARVVRPPSRGLYLSAGVLARLAGQAGDERKASFLDRKDAEREVKWVLGVPDGPSQALGHLPPQIVRIESERVAPNVGYVSFNMFFDPPKIQAGMAKAMEEFRDCDGVILDLRGNPGGIGALASGVSGWFMGESGHNLGTMTGRDFEIHFPIFPRVEPFEGKLAVLVDESSASTTEIFAQGLKDLGRAELFGGRTSGEALPSVFERLPNGDGFQYAIADYVSTGGVRIEAQGVEPHRTVEWDRPALCEGRDLALEAAIDWIEGDDVKP